MADQNDGMQRAGPFADLAAVLREFGVRPESVAEGTGIDIEALTPDTQIPMRQGLVVLEKAAHLTGCPHLGLLLGAREYLTLSALTITEISDALAFSTHAGFSRAFRRWSGRTPTQWRDENLSRR